MKILKKYMILIIIMTFCFYNTNEYINKLKEKDPIMLKIKEENNIREVKKIDATIIENKIIPGKNGKEVDYNESYKKMKEYGSYNEILTVMKEVKPNISIEDNIDKYIISGNKNNRSIALIFKIDEKTNINKIVNILNNKKVPSTFFIDGKLIEKNEKILKKMNDFEIEILSYDRKYDYQDIKTSTVYLDTLLKKKSKYCYTEKENESILNTCKKLKKKTVIPSIIVDKNRYKTIKNNIENGSIISFLNTDYLEEELPLIIDYIKMKGYKIKTLDKLLKEDLEN